MTLPINGVRAVESDGQIVFISDNGRFVITGQIYDVWSKNLSAQCPKCVLSPTAYISKEMGMDVDKLNTISFGHGPKDVVLFVDPRCGVCHKLIGEAKPLAEKYTFKIVVIPALGMSQTCSPKRCTARRTRPMPWMRS